MSTPDWKPDPSGKHELRYHDGASWTDHVSDGGVATTDPYKPGGIRGIAKAVSTRAADARDERLAQAFEESPVGRARAAFARGDEIFQFDQEVLSQSAVVVAMANARAYASTSDPSAVLNAVCAEGWDLVTGSFVFVEQGSQSRDKFLSSGQQVAVKGVTVGYYLFRRKAA